MSSSNNTNAVNQKSETPRSSVITSRHSTTLTFILRTAYLLIRPVLSRLPLQGQRMLHLQKVRIHAPKGALRAMHHRPHGTRRRRRVWDRQWPDLAVRLVDKVDGTSFVSSIAISISQWLMISRRHRQPDIIVAAGAQVQRVLVAEGHAVRCDSHGFKVVDADFVAIDLALFCVSGQSKLKPHSGSGVQMERIKYGSWPEQIPNEHPHPVLGLWRVWAAAVYQ